MPKGSLNVSLKGADDIFSTEESRQEQQREQVQQIPIGELFPFKDHPFKVLDDESMQRTVESVEQYGVLSPLIARPRPEGGYEIISGHRRQHAAQLAGLDALPVIVRQMDDDAHRAGCRVGACDRQPQCRKIHPVLCRRIPPFAERRADCGVFRGDLEAFPQVGRHPDSPNAERQRFAGKSRSIEYF